MRFTQRMLGGVASVSMAAAGVLGLTAASSPPLPRGQTAAVASAHGQASSPRVAARAAGWRRVDASALLGGAPADVTASVRDRGSRSGRATVLS